MVSAIVTFALFVWFGNLLRVAESYSSHVGEVLQTKSLLLSLAAVMQLLDREVVTRAMMSTYILSFLLCCRVKTISCGWT